MIAVREGNSTLVVPSQGVDTVDDLVGHKKVVLFAANDFIHSSEAHEAPAALVIPDRMGIVTLLVGLDIFSNLKGTMLMIVNDEAGDNYTGDNGAGYTTVCRDSMDTECGRQDGASVMTLGNFFNGEPLKAQHELSLTTRMQCSIPGTRSFLAHMLRIMHCSAKSPQRGENMLSILDTESQKPWRVYIFLISLISVHIVQA